MWDSVIALSGFVFVWLTKALLKIETFRLSLLQKANTIYTNTISTQTIWILSMKICFCKPANLPSKSNNWRSQHSTFPPSGYVVRRNVDLICKQQTADKNTARQRCCIFTSCSLDAIVGCITPGTLLLLYCTLAFITVLITSFWINQTNHYQ